PSSLAGLRPTPPAAWPGSAVFGDPRRGRPPKRPPPATPAAAAAAPPATPMRNGVGSTGSAPPVKVTEAARSVGQSAAGRIERRASFGVVMTVTIWAQSGLQDQPIDRRTEAEIFVEAPGVAVERMHRHFDMRGALPTR